MFKRYYIFGICPPENLSNEDKSVNVAGLKWFSKSDDLSLNLNEINFSKKIRGKRSASYLTVSQDVSVPGEVFDLLGRFTPITACFKLDLSDLSKRRLDWDDSIPNELMPTWKNNFEIISKLREIKFQRVIVPKDSLNLDMETIEMADAKPA